MGANAIEKNQPNRNKIYLKHIFLNEGRSFTRVRSRRRFFVAADILHLYCQTGRLEGSHRLQVVILLL